MPKLALTLPDLVAGVNEWKLSQADKQVSEMMPESMAPIFAENALKRFALLCDRFDLDPEKIAGNLDAGMRGK